MAGELRVEMIIGGAVDPTLGQAFSQIVQQIAQQVDQVESLALRIGDALRLTTQSALPLATAFQTANHIAVESAGKWQAALDDIARKLSGQLDLLSALTKAYADLGKAAGGIRSPAVAQPSEKDSAREKITDASQTLVKSASSSVDRYAHYEGIVTKLVRQGETDPSKWEEKKAAVEAEIGRMMYATSLGRTEAASQLWGMYDAGMTLDASVSQGRLAARFSDGQQVDERVTSGLFRTLTTNGVSGEQLENVLNSMIDKSGNFGVGNTAEAVTRLLPALGGGPEDVARLVAILQQEAEKTGNPVEVMSAARARFLEYKQAGGSQAADLQQYGQKYMPTTSVAPDHIQSRLEDRKQTLEWQQKERESSSERLSVGIGGALAPIYSTWTNVMTQATNLLGVVVEKLSGVVTVLGGVVVGAAALVTGYAAFAKGKLLLDAGKAVLGPQGKVLTEAWKRSDVPGSSTGAWARVKQAARTVDSFVPDGLRPTKASKWGGGIAGAIGGAFMAAETFENAETGREKAEGYGEAAGTVVGTVLGGFLGPVGAIAGSYVGAVVGKSVGRKINEYWGDDGKKNPENADPSSSEASVAGTPQLGAAAKEAGGGPSIPAVQQPTDREPGDAVRATGSTPAERPASQTPGAGSGQPGAAFGGQSAPAALQLAGREPGEVVRSMATSTATPALPATVGPTNATITNTTSQQFSVSPSISINVQGIVTDPAELARVLEPEVQRMFAGLATRANTGGEIYDTTNQLYGYA
ncbi:hypothetical protein V0R50_19650 [Pseudomonas sp. 148P]|uniref:Glycine zipper domain-containing protein n=1 Tax=Pseudomonas ulcerans TaxID=3115852 RepID=A0ABU7HV86_9PSED|nr:MULTISPECIES: hypothetical protein [unclassified Pseudomonas]MEE1924282.1 hypothetical protein [Pseudomonas sp. 147P]MEE1935451.1 hypothetical protein [Pseudomonas sp. 148P]